MASTGFYDPLIHQFTPEVLGEFEEELICLCEDGEDWVNRGARSEFYNSACMDNLKVELQTGLPADFNSPVSPPG